MFVGRVKEKETLLKCLENDKNENVLVYGRRRIGKSELIKECLDKVNYKKIYYECREVSEASNVEGICNLISSTFNFPKIKFDSFDEVLSFFFNESKKERIVLVLDEYPYLKKKIDGLDSIIQSYIDQNKDSKLKLILCGSQIEIMKSLLEKANPLYGRFTIKLHIKEMDYYDSSKFYDDYSNEDKVMLYSVFGGVPYYNQLIDTSKTAKENIIRLVIEENSRLETEINYNLKSEISKIANANEVFETIAKGYCNFSDILSHSHVSSSPSLADIINKLLELELIEKVTPINNSRRPTYQICDNLSNFYYRYISRNISSRNIMNENDFYKVYIENDFTEQYIPKVFERICKEYLIRKNIKGEIKPLIKQIGKYYCDDPINKKNGEFDVVTLDDNGYIFYECKYTSSLVDDNAIDKEIKQIEESPLNAYKYGFFSKNGFNIKDDKNIICYDINDLFKGE